MIGNRVSRLVQQSLITSRLSLRSSIVSHTHPKVLLPGFRSDPVIPTLTTDYSSVDHVFEKDRLIKEPPPYGENNRDFTYFLIGFDQMIFLSLSRLALIRVSKLCLYLPPLY